MKGSRFSDSQILAILKKAENGTPVPELCREAKFFIDQELLHVSFAVANGAFLLTAARTVVPFLILLGASPFHIAGAGTGNHFLAFAFWTDFFLLQMSRRDIIGLITS